jgi:hypothetical protein
VRTVMTRSIWLALGASTLLAGAEARAATFAAPLPVAGFGDQPALAQVNAASLGPDGSVAIVGSADMGSNRRAVAAFGNAAGVGPARGFGPPAGAYDLAAAANASGDFALTFSVGHVAYLTRCHAGACAPTARVGTSDAKPQSAVALQPGTGRTTVIWRGRTGSGVRRLQWRITTNGVLGKTHTLAEIGDTPAIATDMSGKTVAVWLADRRSGRGVRTAARRVGDFLRPTSITRAPAAALRLIAGDRAGTVAAWLTAAGGIDPQQPSGAVQIATRTPATAFGAPRTLGTGSTLSLAGSPAGDAIVVTDRHVGGSAVVVSASRRFATGDFGPMVDVSPPQFISDVLGATGAVADGGRAVVSWASGADPSNPSSPAGVFATTAEPSGTFGAPQQLADRNKATLPQPTATAITSAAAIVAWTGPDGARVSRADG